MDSGLYAAYTGLLSRTQALDTASNNLANASTSGFRAQRDYFRGVMTDLVGSESQVGGGVNGFGVLGGSLADLSQGVLQTTGNPLDLALSGAGFFAVKTAAGTQYTRDGAFVRGTDGTLQTLRGEAVLDAQGAKIVVPSGTVSVSDDGTVAVNGAVAGQVGVFDFANPAGLVMQGTNRFAAGGQVAIAGTATVTQGALEGANQDAVTGTMQLVLIQRQAEMMQKALGQFDTGFDKVAEELGRV